MDQTQAPPALDLADIQAAMEAADRQTPSVVVGAFLPVAPEVLGHRLVPITAGHDLVFQALDHPAARGELLWTPDQIALAIFILTRPSRDSHAAIADDSFERRFFEFLDQLPPDGLTEAAVTVMRHWLRRAATAVPMQAPGRSAQKKTADSAGG